MSDREKQPRPGYGWERIDSSTLERFGYLAHSAWQRGPACAISTLQDAEYPTGEGIGLQWLVSISRRGKRPRDTDVRAALRAFEMRAAEEDNHHPGNARQFWLPVDPAHRAECECKLTEQVVVERDGYRWSNPTDGPCRGCEIAPVLGRPCPLHASQAGAP